MFLKSSTIFDYEPVRLNGKTDYIYEPVRSIKLENCDVGS